MVLRFLLVERCKKITMRKRKEREPLSDEQKEKRSEAISRIVLPLANATLASIARVVVEHLFKGA